MSDVLIHADEGDLEHKLRENIDDPEATRCYWRVSGTPRRCSQDDAILFSDGEDIWAAASIVEVEGGRIWFDPVRRVRGDAFDVEIDAPTRGFAYIPENSARCPRCSSEKFYPQGGPGSFWCEMCQLEYWLEGGDWWSIDESGEQDRVENPHPHTGGEQA